MSKTENKIEKSIKQIPAKRGYITREQYQKARNDSISCFHLINKFFLKNSGVFDYNLFRLFKKQYQQTLNQILQKSEQQKGLYDLRGLTLLSRQIKGELEEILNANIVYSQPFYSILTYIIDWNMHLILQKKKAILCYACIFEEHTEQEHTNFNKIYRIIDLKQTTDKVAQLTEHIEG